MDLTRPAPVVCVAYPRSGAWRRVDFVDVDLFVVRIGHCGIEPPQELHQGLVWPTHERRQALVLVGGSAFNHASLKVVSTLLTLVREGFCFGLSQPIFQDSTHDFWLLNC